VRIEDCNSPTAEDWPRIRMWYLMVFGRNDTVADCTFARLRNYGQMLAAQDLPTEGLLGLHILHNRFGPRPYLDEQNGYEIIQIGWSGEHARPAGALIQGNTFEKCDGENEIITLKASDIYVRGNTFTGCQGVLCLREADRVLVQGNTFDGLDRADTGGVRLAGAGHVIIENTFRKLRRGRTYYAWPICLMAASGERAGEEIQGYGRAQNILIAQNRFEQCGQRIALGIYPRPEYSFLPRAIRVQNNTFTGAIQAGGSVSAFDFVAPGLQNELGHSITEIGTQIEP
jgi:poly(beta-D-mannuronate) lyase